MNPSTADIRQLLTEHFSDDELSTFCFDYFPEVYNSFSAGMPKGQKIQILIEHCQRRGTTADLVALIEKIESRTPGQAPIGAQDVVRKAQALLDIEELDETIRILRQARKQYRANADIERLYLASVYRRGVRYYVTEYNLPAARHAFQEVMEIDPYYENAPQLLAEVERDLRHLAEVRAPSARLRRVPVPVARVGVLLLVFAVLIGGVAIIATGLVPISTSTPAPTFTSTPSATPRPMYTPTVKDYQRVADFEICDEMGSASPENAPDNSLEFQCTPVVDRDGIVADLDYKTSNAWAAFWIKLNDADFSPFDTLTFFAKGDSSKGVLPAFKLELKRQGNSRVSVIYLRGITDEWKQFVVPFDQLREFGDVPPLCGWDAMSELVFTFESDRSGQQGTVYLDDIYVERRGEGAPSPGLECIPAETPSPPSSPVIADFDSCAGINYLGGPMGAAYDPPDSLVETYVQEPGRGCVARLEYHIRAWSAFWMKLQDVDLSPYSNLVFDIKADPQLGIPAEMKIELKRANGQEVSIIYVSEITADWQTKRVPLSDFGPTGVTAPLSALTAMEELAFTFEANRSGTDGVVYLDNIALEP